MRLIWEMRWFFVCLFVWETREKGMDSNKEGEESKEIGEK